MSKRLGGIKGCKGSCLHYSYRKQTRSLIDMHVSKGCRIQETSDAVDMCIKYRPSHEKLKSVGLYSPKIHQIRGTRLGRFLIFQKFQPDFLLTTTFFHSFGFATTTAVLQIVLKMEYI